MLERLTSRFLGNCTEILYDTDPYIHHVVIGGTLRFCTPSPGASQLDTIVSIMVRMQTWIFPIRAPDAQQVIVRPSNITDLFQMCFPSVGQCNAFFEGMVPASEKEAIENRFVTYMETLESSYNDLFIKDTMTFYPLLGTALLVGSAVIEFFLSRALRQPAL